MRKMRALVRLLIASAIFVPISLLGAPTLSNAAIGTTVTFVVYDGQSPVPTQTQVAQSDGAASLELFSTLFPSVTYVGHTFAFWSTEVGGGGSTYADGAVFPFTQDTTLYAQWIGPPHTVTFAENASPTDQVVASQVAAQPTALTKFALLNPTFNFEHHMFISWNTDPGGTGTEYLDGDVYNFQSAKELYAQWAPDPETVSFLPGAGTGTQPSIATAYGSNIDLPSTSAFSRTDYSLSGWNTSADGTGTQYKLGAHFAVGVSETLYATWTRNHDQISFAVRVGKYHVAPMTLLAGNSIRLPSVAKIKSPGHSFAGWYSAPTGGKFVGKAGSKFVPVKSTTLFAHWANNPLVHVEFSDNGGVGHIPARSVLSGQSVVIPSGTPLHRSGFTFRGWASSPRAPGPTVYIGSHVMVTRTRILYALWRRVLPADTPQTLLGSVSIFAPDSSVLTPAMRHAVALIAIGINQHNRTLVLLYGYATAKDSAQGSALLSLQRALAVEKQLSKDLAGLNDVGVTIHAVGEGRLTNSVLTSFRDVEVFAN